MGARLLVLAPLLAACGGGDAPKDSEAPPELARSPAAGVQQAESDEAASKRLAVGPNVASNGGQKIRVFSPQKPRVRPDFADLAALVNPAHPSDPWPGELLAMSAESSLEQFLKALRGSDSKVLRSMVTREVRGSVPGADGTTQERVGEALLGALRTGLGFDATSDRRDVLEVSVVRVEAPELLRPEALARAEAAPRSGRTIARVRIGTRPETGARDQRQTLATLDVAWRLGRRVRISEVSLTEVRESRAAAPFRDVTAAVLTVNEERDGSLTDLLLHGALEAVERTDRLSSSSDIYLAMHGAAVGDLDGNGWEDLVVGRAAGQPNLCFMNEGGRLVEEGALRGLDVLEDTGGVLIVDLDGDGARDVVFGRGAEVAIAWNDGQGRFDEVQSLISPDGTARVYSISAADVDGDGDLDLYDTRYFRSGGYGAQAPTPYHDAMNGARNVFWRNRLIEGENGVARAFRDDTAAIGLDAENDRFSLSAVFDDFDADGDLDLYVANDFGQNTLYAWEGAGFVVSSEESGLTDKAAGMGISVADVNLDGASDLVISNMHSAAGMRVTRESKFGVGLDDRTRAEFARHARGNTLFRGSGDGLYEDVSDRAGASPGGWAWGARFLDWDRDGLVDIVVPNGFLSGRFGPDLQSFFWRRVVGKTPLRLDAGGAPMDAYLAGWSVISHLSQFDHQHWNAHERTFAYANRGDFRFDDVTLASGLGFADDGRALVTADFDGDGRLDLAFRNRTSPILRVLQGVHQGAQGWIALTLVDRAPNVDAVGARVDLEAGGVERSARVTAGDGFLGSSTKTLYFGLGDETSLANLRVTWADGSLESFSVEAGASDSTLVNRRWRLVRGTGTPEPVELGGPSYPPLDRALAAPFASASPEAPAARIPLLEEFPLGAWRLPAFDGPALRIDEASGETGTFAYVWATQLPGSVATLSQLRGAEAELEALGVRVHPMCLDGVRDEEKALAALEQAGFTGDRRGGRVGRADRTVLEMLLSRTLAPYDDLPLPVGLLFDAQGDLVELWVGALDPGRLLRDVKVLAERADSSSTLALTGGRWTTQPPTRSLGDIPDKLRQVGLNELAEFLQASLAGR